MSYQDLIISKAVQATEHLIPGSTEGIEYENTTTPPRPLPEGILVDIMLSNGDMFCNKPATIVDWETRYKRDDIVAFKVIGPAKGYKY